MGVAYVMRFSTIQDIRFLNESMTYEPKRTFPYYSATQWWKFRTTIDYIIFRQVWLIFKFGEFWGMLNGYSGVNLIHGLTHRETVLRGVQTESDRCKLSGNSTLKINVNGVMTPDSGGSGGTNGASSAARIKGRSDQTR